MDITDKSLGISVTRSELETMFSVEPAGWSWSAPSAFAGGSRHERGDV
jgi:hypothetical protein